MSLTDGKKTGKVASSTVVKAMHVLNALTELTEQDPQGASVSEITRVSGEHASSVCKHLAAFEQYGLVEQDAVTGRYRIGYFALKLSNALLKRMNIREIAYPFLRRLADQTGETTHLVVQSGLRVVYIDKVESSRTIRIHSDVGTANPMYCTGVGKALLAYSPETVIRQVINEGLKPYTKYTLTTEEALREDLEKTRIRGYSIDYEEHEADLRCVGAPVFNHLGEVAASISIAGPKWRMSDDRLPELGALVRETALEITRKLGGEAPAPTDKKDPAS